MIHTFSNENIYFDIPNHIENIRFDIGLSYCAPNSALKEGIEKVYNNIKQRI